MDKETLYTPQEQQDFELIRQKRLEIIDTMFQSGAPSRDKDVIAVNQVLTSMETSINNKAINRLKMEETASKDALLDTVAEVLKSINQSKVENMDIDRETTLSDKFTEIDTVPGETDIHAEKLELEQFTNNNKEE